MSSGLKMFFARHTAKNNQLLSVATLGPGDRDFLVCQFCKAKVAFVNTYQRSGRTVAAYLRLWPGVEHSINCKNVLKDSVKQLVADSRNTEQANDIFHAQSDGFIFRMNVLVDAEHEMRRAEKNLEEAKDPADKERKGTLYQSTQKRISDYFNSAAGIAKIRARIEDSTDKKALSEMVKIEFNKQHIQWNYFFYEEQRYPALFKKAAQLKHPVAILLTVKTAAKLIPTAKKPFFSLKGEVAEEKQTERFAPAINTLAEELLSNFSPEDELIVVGRVQVSTKEWQSLLYKNLTFWIAHKKQVTKISE